jgi:hypothetical protein
MPVQPEGLMLGMVNLIQDFQSKYFHDLPSPKNIHLQPTLPGFQAYSDRYPAGISRF